MARALGEPRWLGPSPMKMTWMALSVPSWQHREKNHERELQIFDSGTK